jgi:hypothetical protein
MVISLESVEVSGNAESGEFRGELHFSRGLQVISADNAFGKSLSVTTVAWCLGAEAVFGLPDNDPSCFPLAVRDEIKLDGESSLVLTSQASIVFMREDGDRLRLTRAIKGDGSRIAVQEIATDGTIRESLFSARYHTMSDSTGGFQFFFFNWINWRHQKTITYKGAEAEVYIENLIPLFYIDQDEGWTDIQALQVTRYGQQQIGEFAVEFLLAGFNAMAARLAQLRTAQTTAALKEKQRLLADRIVAGLNNYGWRIELSSFGSLDDLVARWRNISLSGILADRFATDLPKQIAALRSRVELLRTALTKAPIDPADASAPVAASQRVIELKGRRHKLSEDASTSRVQVDQTEILLESLEDRLHAAEDLYRLKTTGVGRIDKIECPTCHRDLDPTTFALTTQSTDSVANHIEALKRDRDLLVRNLDSMRATLATLFSELQTVSTELLEAERALMNVTSAVGSVREHLAQTAAELASTERAVDRAIEINRNIELWEEEIQAWLQEAGELESSSGSSDFQNRRSAFIKALTNYLIAFGHSAINQATAGDVSLNEQYTPMLGLKRIRSLGSASDQSRLIAAYTLALAEASVSIGGMHPGIVILDEPLQQNPDPKHRELFLSFLSKALAKSAKFQVIIFTSLRQAEIAQLKRGGVSVATPDGEKFLKRVPNPKGYFDDRGHAQSNASR